MCKAINIFILAGCLLIAACEQQPKKIVSTPVVPKGPGFIDPFNFHKLIEVAPGNDFDIVSWGLGG